MRPSALNLRPPSAYKSAPASDLVTPTIKLFSPGSMFLFEQIRRSLRQLDFSASEPSSIFLGAAAHTARATKHDGPWGSSLLSMSAIHVGSRRTCTPCWPVAAHTPAACRRSPGDPTHRGKAYCPPSHCGFPQSVTRWPEKAVAPRRFQAREGAGRPPLTIFFGLSLLDPSYRCTPTRSAMRGLRTPLTFPGDHFDRSPSRELCSRDILLGRRIVVQLASPWMYRRFPNPRS